MIYITGDTHSKYVERLSTKAFPAGKELGENDFIIIAGDFGGLWSNHDNSERYALKWLQENTKYTTLFVDGNHENFDMIDILPQEERWGGTVGKVQDRLYHLKRGFIYTIDDVNIFTFGGGLSIDKRLRVEGISWWAREYPSNEELERAWKNINSGKHIDYVVTHTPPTKIIDHYFNHGFGKSLDITSLHLQDMSDRLYPRIKKWYFGHMHIDEQLNEKYVALYHGIIPLGSEYHTRPQL